MYYLIFSCLNKLNFLSVRKDSFNKKINKNDFKDFFQNICNCDFRNIDQFKKINILIYNRDNISLNKNK